LPSRLSHRARGPALLAELTRSRYP
jgi:hypothetical protein